MTIREFVRTLWEGKYLLLAAVVVVVLGTVLYLDRQDPQYSATSTVQLMTATSPLETMQETLVTVATSNEDVTSEPVVTAAAAELGYDGDLGALVATVSAEPGSEDGLFVNIRAVSGDTDEAIAVSNAFAAAYAAQLTSLRADQVAVIDGQKATLSAQLDLVRERLEVDPTDPLALAEQGAIVSGYQTLVTQANVLNSINPPGAVESSADSASLVGPSPAVVIAVAILAGLLAGIGLAFARRGLDLRVRTASEATRLTGVAVLAELTGVRATDRRYRSSRTLPVSSMVATPFTESIRELRTAVQVSLSDVDRVVVVVTATDPRAARSFVAANLAASFALSGRRTIAVSGDLRRPQLDSLLPPPEGWTGPDDELRPTQVPNLSVFPLREEEMDPADYLASTQARQIMDRLRATAEVVVVDAPPVLAAADATILGGYADGTVLIASAGQTDRAVLTEAVARLKINNVTVVGLALAGVRGNRRMLYASTYGEERQSATHMTTTEAMAAATSTTTTSATAATAATSATTAPADDPGQGGATPASGAGAAGSQAAPASTDVDAADAAGAGEPALEAASGSTPVGTTSTPTSTPTSTDSAPADQDAGDATEVSRDDLLPVEAAQGPGREGPRS